MKVFISGRENETTQKIFQTLTEQGHEVYCPYFTKEGEQARADHSQVLRSKELDLCEVAIFDLDSEGIGISDHVYANRRGMACISIAKKGGVEISENSSVKHFSKVYYYNDIEDMTEIIRVFMEGIVTTSKERQL